MSATPEEQDVIAKLFPDVEGGDGEDAKEPEPVTGADLSSKLDEIEDEDLSADSEVRAKFKHVLHDHADTPFTKESLTSKMDVMAKAKAVGLSEVEYVALDGAFKACTPEDGGAEIEKAVLKEYILKELKANFTAMTIDAWSTVLAPPPPKPEPVVQEVVADGENNDDGADKEPVEETPVITTITLDALLAACGHYVYSFKTKMSIGEVSIVKAATTRCSEEGPEYLASTFLETLMESKDQVSANVVASWTSFLGPLADHVSEEVPEGGLPTSEAAFKAKRSAQNWSAATGLTPTEVAVILEAFESLDPDTWYQGGSVGKRELYEFATADKLPICTRSSWTEILRGDEGAEEDQPIAFENFLSEREKVVHSAQYGLFVNEISSVMASFGDLSPSGFDCHASFPSSEIKAKLDTSDLTEANKASWTTVLGKAEDLSYFSFLGFRADHKVSCTTGISTDEARLIRSGFVALDSERDEFLNGTVKSADLYTKLVETGKAAGPAEKLAWATFLKSDNSSNEDVRFKEITIERGLQTQEAEFQIPITELKRIRQQFTMLDDAESGKVTFTDLVSKLKDEHDLLGESMGELWSQLPNHVQGVDKDGKVSLADFLAGRSEIVLMNQGNLTSAEILHIKSQYQNDDTQLEWKNYLLNRAPFVVEKRTRKAIPTGEDAKKYLMNSRTGERDGEVVTLPDLLIQGCTELCRHKPQGMDAVTWLGQWLLENNPNQPMVDIPDS